MMIVLAMKSRNQLILPKTLLLNKLAPPTITNQNIQSVNHLTFVVIIELSTRTNKNDWFLVVYVEFKPKYFI